MNAPATPVFADPAGRYSPALTRRLRREVDGDVLFDAFSRGRYSTDASIYQIEPVGVVVPRTEESARIALQIAAEEGVPILPRGAGTSQCGQSVDAFNPPLARQRLQVHRPLKTWTTVASSQPNEPAGRNRTAC